MTATTPRLCSWCRSPIPPVKRADSKFCRVSCRQAHHRFATAVGGPRHAGETVLRLAYADPPYIGMSARYYAEHQDFAGEVDHAELIRRLSTFDGWALSCSAASLPAVLALCPPGVRIASWHRGERPTRSSGPLNGWEPVIFAGGRAYPSRSTSDTTPHRGATRRVHLVDTTGRAARPRRNRRLEQLNASRLTVATRDASRTAGAARRVDVLEYFSRPRLTDPARVVGAKPATFIRWMFDLLGAEPQDDFTDLFPGSGGVDRAWNLFTRTQPKGPTNV